MDLSLQDCSPAVIATAAGRKPGVENMPIANQQQIHPGEREVAKLGDSGKPGQEDGWSINYSAVNSIITGGSPVSRSVQGLKSWSLAQSTAVKHQSHSTSGDHRYGRECIFDVAHARDGKPGAGGDAMHEETAPPLLSPHTRLEGQPETEEGSSDESDSICPAEDAFDNLTEEDALGGSPVEDKASPLLLLLTDSSHKPLTSAILLLLC